MAPALAFASGALGVARARRPPLPGVELNAGLSLIPIVNTSLVTKEIVSGTFHWGYIALIFFSSCMYAGAALWAAIRLFQREDVLFRV